MKQISGLVSEYDYTASLEDASTIPASWYTNPEMLRLRRNESLAFESPPGTASASDFQMPETSMRENLEKLAYGLWQERGCPYGSPEFDWLEAERSLRESSEQVSR
jgi:Protein of unknown function (DUF2934)